MPKDIDYYKHLDPTDKPLVQPKFLKNLREKQKDEQKTLQHFFDNDVLDTLRQHNNEHDRQRLNNMIRLLFA